MFNGKTTQCVINPALAQEKRAAEARRPLVRTKRVLVVGAGPAGCEAAILLAERGHDVELVERDDRIGGQLHAWSAARVLQAEIGSMVTFYARELEQLGVEVRLATDAAALDLSSYDNVLLATGTRAADAPDGAIDAVAMLSDRALPDADDLTVFGDSETAMFAALWLRAGQARRAALPRRRRGRGHQRHATRVPRRAARHPGRPDLDRSVATHDRSGRLGRGTGEIRCPRRRRGRESGAGDRNPDAGRADVRSDPVRLLDRGADLRKGS
jgi:glycine/D-amino acid oxidase-like deaminating enzyme